MKGVFRVDVIAIAVVAWCGSVTVCWADQRVADLEMDSRTDATTTTPLMRHSVQQRRRQQRDRNKQRHVQADSTASANHTVPNQYIILYHANVTDVSYKTGQLLHRVQQRLQNAWRSSSANVFDATTRDPPKIVYTFARDNWKGTVVAGLTPDDALDLATNDADIRLMEQDFWVHADETSGNEATQDFHWSKEASETDTSDSTSWGLDRLNQPTLPLDGNVQQAWTGAGVDVYILDSGLYPEHDQFRNNADNPSSTSTSTPRAVCSYNAWSDSRAHCYDGTGHGTHVAGTIGGITLGVARGVQLRAVKVLDSHGHGRASHVLAGIEHVVNQTKETQRPTVVNMSFGGSHSAILNAAVEAAVREGIVFVTSAGNDGRRACLQSPASSTAAITVAASNARDRAALYSNYGKCVDIFGPGTDIRSAWNKGANSTMVMSGTSMACPHVAGVAALYLERDPTLTPAAVRDALLQDAVPGALSLLGLHSVSGSPNLLVNTEAIVALNR